MIGKRDSVENGSRAESRGRAGLRVRRRTLLIAAAALLAVMAFVVLPAYLSTTPTFFGRYPELDGQYDPWTTSSHAEVGCEECHVPPGTLARTGYRLAMIGQAYLGLVGAGAPEVFESPTNPACLVCHNDLRTVSPKGDLQIPHRAHVTILEMDCVECHNYLVHELNPSGDHLPTMEGCLQCHNGDRAKDACWACHTQKAAPESHSSADWLITHADGPDYTECAECHDWAGDWCVQCHTTRPRSHSTDWRAVHGLAVAKHRNCEACHEGVFCERCHGVVPELNFDPSLRRVE